jgi:hypothetical protein
VLAVLGSITAENPPSDPTKHSPVNSSMPFACCTMKALLPAYSFTIFKFE